MKPEAPPPTQVPRVATLDGFTEALANAGGLDIRRVDPLTTILVTTYNSLYRIVPLGGLDALVQGGQFFPEATRARFDGSSFGGSFLKIAWIGEGLRMEIVANDQRIVTSPVRHIEIEQQDSTMH